MAVSVEKYPSLRELTSSGEFATLPYHHSDPSLCVIGLGNANYNKNRYNNIIPPDTTRIILPGGAYINANLVDLGSGYAPMIACQGPLTTTFEDFWRMVLQYQSKVILMVTPLMESKNLGDVLEVKCDKYWPDVGQKSIHGEFTVENLGSQEVNPTVVISRLRVLFNDQVHFLHHIYYSGIPDSSVSDDDEVHLILCILISFLGDQRPFICHCSAGAGRTGIIATILRCLHTKESPLEAIRKLRYQRHGMVQTRRQFRFIRSFLGYLDENL